MKFMTLDECGELCERLGIPLDERGYPLHGFPDEMHTKRLDVPQQSAGLLYFARTVEEALQPRDDCLMWVTAWDIFDTSRDRHLYYCLRQANGDFRLLEDAPGHYLLGYESVDFVSFLALAVMLSWDVHLIPTMGYNRAFLSHDEYIEFASDSASNLPE